MSFRQLCMAATVIRGDHDPLHLVHEWSAKREAIHLQVIDLPYLVADYKARKRERHPTIPTVHYIDSVPTLRLTNACESTCHGLYALAEVAAGFANKISKGAIPGSFNALRKKVRGGEGDPELIATLAGCEWYERVRELRTEWTHHSSLFIGEAAQGEPVFVVRSYRRPSDREHFKTQTQMSITEIIQWTTRAISLLDDFGGYLLKKYVLPSFDMNATMYAPKRDAEGFPVILEDGRFDGETISVREYLVKNGVVVTS